MKMVRLYKHSCIDFLVNPLSLLICKGQDLTVRRIQNLLGIPVYVISGSLSLYERERERRFLA